MFPCSPNASPWSPTTPNDRVGEEPCHQQFAKHPLDRAVSIGQVGLVESSKRDEVIVFQLVNLVVAVRLDDLSGPVDRAGIRRVDRAASQVRRW